MKIQHTPAPWNVSEAEFDWDGNVKYTLEGIKEIRWADRDLISYAPDLLTSLEAVLKKYVVVDAYNEDENGVASKARALIAKVRGEL